MMYALAELKSDMRELKQDKEKGTPSSSGIITKCSDMEEFDELEQALLDAKALETLVS